MQCTSCQSDNTQRLEMAFKQGTQNINTTSGHTGIGFSGGRLGIGSGATKTKGKQQSLLGTVPLPLNHTALSRIILL